MDFRKEDEEFSVWMERKGCEDEAFGIAANCERQIRVSYLGPKDLEKDDIGGGIWRCHMPAKRFHLRRNEAQGENFKKNMEMNGSRERGDGTTQ